MSHHWAPVEDPMNVGGVAPPRPLTRDWMTKDRTRTNYATDFLSLVDYLHVEEWMEEARCASSGTPDAWFPGVGPANDDTLTVKRICAACPVARPCLTFALKRPYLSGIWGGTTKRERNAYHRKARA